MKFNKIIALDNIGFTEDRYVELDKFADSVIIHRDYPSENSEKIKRIGDAECTLVSWNTTIDREVIEACKGLKYIGMCCSLYDEKSANVDIVAARENGIQVLGVRDYGDPGVAEYVSYKLIELLHGFNGKRWKEGKILEITGFKVGIIGLGVTGTLVAQTLQMFGADLYYSDLSRKPELEEKGIKYLPLDDLLRNCDIISTHLPKNLRVLNKEKLDILGTGKMVINPSIGPTYVIDDMFDWLNADKSNFLLSERSSMAADLYKFSNLSNFAYTDVVSGFTEQAKQRMIGKVLNNIATVLSK